MHVKLSRSSTPLELAATGGDSPNSVLAERKTTESMNTHAIAECKYEKEKKKT